MRPYPEGAQALVFDSEQRGLNKWLQQLYAINGNIGSVPYPEGVEPLPFDDEQRLEVKINAIYDAGGTIVDYTFGAATDVQISQDSGGAWDNPPHGDYWQALVYSYRTINGTRYYSPTVGESIQDPAISDNGIRNVTWTDGSNADGVRVLYYDVVLGAPVFVGSVDVLTGVGHYESTDPALLTGPEVFTPSYP